MHPSNEHGKTILVVDDEAVIRDLCGKALRGHRIVEVGSGDEALKLVEQGGIDVVITDVMMPKMNGITLLKRIKEIQPTQIVIMMTGFAEKDVILNALKEDADDFITKPLNLLQLKTAVEKALVKKALKEEIANLRSLDRLKTNFLSLISHKFRTPITVISLFIQDLASSSIGKGNTGFQANLEGAYEEILYLERLVRDLLVFSRVMDNGEGIRPELCELEYLLQKVVAEVSKNFRKPGIVVSTDFEDIPPVYIDREKMTFAIKQVIENAFKFSGDEGTVGLSLRLMDGNAHIIVSDEGKGISREELPKIFEKFYQVDTDNTGQIPGFGLGLFYAREFVKQHQGHITVESIPGQGTSVAITIPAAQHS